MNVSALLLAAALTATVVVVALVVQLLAHAAGHNRSAKARAAAAAASRAPRAEGCAARAWRPDVMDTIRAVRVLGDDQFSLLEDAVAEETARRRAGGDRGRAP